MSFFRFRILPLLFFAVQVLLFGFVLPLAAQTPEETILQSYERIFIRSSLSMKINVLSDAANDEAADEFYGPLCDLALRFVLENSSLFRDDPDMISITVIAVRGLGKYNYHPAAETLWQTFMRFSDRVIRYEILEVLPSLDTQPLTGRINEFLVDLNFRYSSGQGADAQLLSTLFELLKRAGDDSSYPVLFASSLIYSDEIEKEAIRALYEVEGDFYAFCISVILNNPPAEKLHAFKLALAKDDFAADKKGMLAEAALEAALALFSDRNEIRELAESSIRVIKETEWIRALPHVLKYYNQSFAAYRADSLRIQPLLNAVFCLGSLKSAEAANPLALQLGLYNSRAGTLRIEDVEVVLALINALGHLGYKASYDVLHNASIQPYPDEIKDAARKALTALQW
ncbi:MAG: hypothetical protein FWG27_06545 [Treponema sp.]|nr:hypothetical protein [Treponema sp.]